MRRDFVLVVIGRKIQRKLSDHRVAGGPSSGRRRCCFFVRQPDYQIDALDRVDLHFLSDA
jgi:hypothetical protein